MTSKNTIKWKKKSVKFYIAQPLWASTALLCKVIYYRKIIYKILLKVEANLN